MKKTIRLLLIFLTLILLTACSDNGTGKAATEALTNKPTGSEIPGKDNAARTLMIYMIGSDLEAKTGAGTNDMTEMLESKTDLSSANVIIFTGGSKHWHTEGITKEEHSILQLTAEGFKSVSTMALSSMGEPANLTAFLNYCYTNYPSDSFSLIMWDHGDGPVIGYGKDMLFGNDSLTLNEMKTALEASPFGKDNKLDWVGFDACLMSSAELAYVWSDYADYLVASQEIEPAFGWNYGFLTDYPTMDTVSLLKKITADYLASCEEYYAKKGYDDRDTTLACIDLSKADSLSVAINGLFTKAASDVPLQYNDLSSRRANTRALGRASTGSEYDLIDLNDMAVRLSDIYPEESLALQKAISEMVIFNATNTDGCCGMSIYYPFYNKTYYEKDWNTVYNELGLFPEYLTYLNSYSKKWLGNDIIGKIAQSKLPAIISPNQYTLELTEEQNKAFTKARYHILQQEGEGLYTRLFTSSNVTKNGNILTANFDGNVIYIKNKFNNYVIPVSNEKDTVGDISRYTVYVGSTNDTALLFSTPYEGWESKTGHHQYHIAVNNVTKKISVSALVPYDTSVDTSSLVGGKLEDSDLDAMGMTTLIFPHDRHKYIKRLENGAIDALANWNASSYFSRYEMNFKDGIDFEFAPLITGRYYIMLEITDTQGNSFCSELLPINATGSLPKPESLPDINVYWTNEEKLKIAELEGVSLYLTISETQLSKGYRLIAENKNSFDVTIKNTNLGINENIYCPDGYFAYFNVPAGQTVEDSRNIDFGDATALKIADMMKSMHFNITIQNYLTKETLVNDRWFNIYISEEKRIIQEDFWSSISFDLPIIGIKAEKQVLGEYEGCTVELLGIGAKYQNDSPLYGGLCFTNPTDKLLVVSVAGISFDSTYVPIESGDYHILPHCSIYRNLYIDSNDIERNNITSASSLTLTLKFSEFATLEGGGGFSKIARFPIQLSSSGEISDFPEGTVLYDKDGIRLTLLKFINGDYGSDWLITFTNTSGKDVKLEALNIKENGKPTDNNYYYDFAFVDAYAGNNERTVFEAAYYAQTNTPPEFSFNVAVMDFSAEKVLYTSKETVTLKPYN